MMYEDLQRKIRAILKESLRKKSATEMKYHCKGQLNKLAASMREMLDSNKRRVEMNPADEQAEVNVRNAYMGLKMIEETKIGLDRAISEMQFNQDMSVLEKLMGRINSMGNIDSVIGKSSFRKKLKTLESNNQNISRTHNYSMEDDILERLNKGMTVNECLKEDILKDSNSYYHTTMPSTLSSEARVLTDEEVDEAFDGEAWAHRLDEL